MTLPSAISFGGSQATAGGHQGVSQGKESESGVPGKAIIATSFAPRKRRCSHQEEDLNNATTFGVNGSRDSRSSEYTGKNLRSHVGGGALHAPFDWQYLFTSPVNWKPSLQWYVTFDVKTWELPSKYPLTISSGFSHDFAVHPIPQSRVRGERHAEDHVIDCRDWC